MNQAILFNDDLIFDEEKSAWRMTGLLSGQIISIYFHSFVLSKMESIDTCTKFDLEEAFEMWLEENEPEGDSIHIEMP
ncbi:MAG: hypothetical protein ACPGTQ_10500 [Colwellia sp.]